MSLCMGAGFGVGGSSMWYGGCACDSVDEEG